MALDLVGGSLFTLLYDGVKQAMVKTSQFKSLLAELKSTLDSLEPRIIEQIGEHNTELSLPNEEIQDLQRQMEEGVKLVQKFSEFRMWNYCCVGDYTDQLIELDRALRKLLEMLRLQEARDVKETLLLSRQNRDKLDEVNRRLIEVQKLLMQQQQKAGDVTKAMDSGNTTETVPELIQGNDIQVAALDGGDALEALFGMLFDAVLDVEDKAVMFKAPLSDLRSTLNSLKPLIEEIAQRNKVLIRPKEELEKITKQMEKGVKLIPKCSKVHPWASCKKSTYTDKLLGLDKFLQRQLYILKMQVARDVRSTIVSIRNVEMAIKQIEESGVLQNQTTGCSAVAEPSPLTLGLDVVLNVEGARDVEETMISIRNTEAGVKPIEESSVVQNQIQTRGFPVVAEPSPPTLGLDVVLNAEETRDVEETMISIRNTEAGVKPIEESGVVQYQLETTGISRICSRKIVSDTSSSAGTSLYLEAKTPTFQSKDDQSTDGHISETSNVRVFSYEESGVLLNQIQTKGWSAVAEPSPPTVGLDVVNEQGTSDVEETKILLRNTEDSSGSVQIEPAEPEQEYRFMGTDVSKVVGAVRKPHSFKVHRSMCIELLKLVDRISRIIPDIEAVRPPCSAGIKALCLLNNVIEKAMQLLQYCSESSKLYLVYTGTVMVSRCQKSRTLLEQNLCQIQSWVPVIMVAEISQVIDDVKGATFKLDPSEEEAGKVVQGLLYQDVSALNSIEDFELKALQLACLRLHITTKKEVLLEKKSIKKLLQKVGDGDPKKKQILTYFFYLLKKYENLILVKQTENESMRQQGSLSSENSGNGFKCNQYAEVEPHAGYGEYEAQRSMLLTAVPPEEFSCGISSRLMYDPVVIASGQTYERMWIQKWFDEGHDTCPKTNVKLAHLSLTPNIAMNESISMWCKKYGVTIPNPSMQPEALDASENSSTSSFGSSMNDLRLQTNLNTLSFESVDNSFNSPSSLTNTEDGLSLVRIDDGSLKYQHAKKFETDLEFPSNISEADLEILSNINELKWDSQCKVVEDVKNYLKCNAQASYSMSSKNSVEALIKFLRDAHDRDDVKAQRDGFKLLSTCVSKNSKGIADLCEDAYSVLASYLDSKVMEEVLAIMEILSGHQHCRSKISASGALPSILKLLNSQNRNIQGQAIKVLYKLSFDKEVCSEMVSLDCIPKLIPFFEDSALTGNCIFILKNLCDTEGARISIAETNGCIASVVTVLDTGTKEEQETTVDVLLSLCSQRIDYCHLIMREGVLPALVQLSINGTQRARINSMQVLRHLRDIDYVHDQEYASSSETTLFSEATTSTFVSNQSTDGHILETSNLRVFRFAELKTATRNFSPEEIIGVGSFGNIFRGWVDEKTLAPSKVGTGMIVAIKKLDPEGLQGVREWQSEVYFLGRLSHPNLVNLLGYCCEGNELLLVYEYMQNGSLENHLFIRIPNKEPLSWDNRIKLAIGAARGLAFLHSSVKQVIYRDFKASNILLDENYNAKISTFGLANLGPTGEELHVSTTVIGSYGYVAPEYIAAGHLYVESDVYGFGVVLLEILTGLRVVDTKRPQGQHNLVDWAKPLLSDKRKLETVIDVRMEGQYSFEAALKTAHITLKCLASDPKSRPSMKEVVETLELIQEIKDY